MKRFDYMVVYSPDDGGYYGEVYEVATGQTVHHTKTYSGRTPMYAARAAQRWIDERLAAEGVR